ncbi:MAG: hypothetical protein PF795_02730 [Kiritimatiellae bacterium]|jgi:hypothetical protein|nr:hypothetical protein [Kiritimatiellia bacterium]
MKYEHAMKDPAGTFTHPENVVEHPSLTTEQKLKILRQWEYDAREKEVAEEENMGGGPDDQLSRILQAIESIQPADSTDPGVNSKQGGEG